MKESTYKRIVAAVFLVTIGKILLAHNLNLLPFLLPEYVFTPKMLLIIIGAYVMIAYRSLKGIFLILIGAYLILPEIPELESYNPRAFWPAILIFLGLGIFIKSISKSSSKKKQAMTTDLNQNTFKSSVIFGGEKKKLSAYEFQGAKITAICGGLELDLTDCYLSKEGNNVIDFNVICGGVVLRVSKEWNIKTEISPIMSGIEDQIYDMPETYVDPAAELRLTGTVIMGGIEINRV